MNHQENVFLTHLHHLGISHTFTQHGSRDDISLFNFEHNIRWINEFWPNLFPMMMNSSLEYTFRIFIWNNNWMPIMSSLFQINKLTKHNLFIPLYFYFALWQIQVHFEHVETHSMHFPTSYLYYLWTIYRYEYFGTRLYFNCINVDCSILNPQPEFVALTFVLMVRTTTLPPSGQKQNGKGSKNGYNHKTLIKKSTNCTQDTAVMSMLMWLCQYVHSLILPH